MEESYGAAVGYIVGRSWVVVSDWPPPAKQFCLLRDRHFFTSIASYHILTWLVWLRYCLDGRQDEVQLKWSSALSTLPVLERKSAFKKGKEA
jgi:hypothetical protein